MFEVCGLGQKWWIGEHVVTSVEVSVGCRCDNISEKDEA